MTDIRDRITGRLGLLGALVAAAMLLAAAPAAQADFGFEPGGVSANTYEGNAAGEITGPETQAGATPYEAATEFTLNYSKTEETTEPTPGVELTQFTTKPEGNVKTIVADLPPGLIGNPEATPKCERFRIADTTSFTPCPGSTQVGTVALSFAGTGQEGKEFSEQEYPLYSMVTREGDVAEFTFVVFSFGGTHVVGSVRVGDYGIRTTISNISTAFALIKSKLTFWGVPADPRHDAERNRACINAEFCIGGGEGSGSAEVPFLRNPTACDGEPALTRISADSFQNPGEFERATAESPPVTGCDRVPFDPTESVGLTSSRADAPTGAEIGIGVPQSQSPGVLASSHLKQAKIEFPEGMAVNAAAVEGLGSCSLSEVDLDSDDAARCPDSSKIGTTAIRTPLADHPLEGSVYLAEQDENPFDSLLALYLVVEDEETGVVLKLPGEVTADEDDGQLTATFDDNPQLPFSRLDVSITGGPRSPLRTPQECGDYSTRVELTGWARPDEVVASDSGFTIDGNCDAGFDPGFGAGTASPVAGGYSPFVLRVTRSEGEESLRTIGARLPEGLLAKLAGVELCSDGQAGSGDCPGGSKVGSATVGVGAGPTPAFLPQPGKDPTGVYLAGPYEGAPYSLVTEVPAQAGPFDLGKVTVRSALHVNPVSAQVRVQSEALPQLIQGIPIDYRDVRVKIDRPGFMINPTSCRPKAVAGRLVSTDGDLAQPASRFQVGGCRDLRFRPGLRLRLFGPKQRAGNPRLTAVLRMGGAQANIDRMAVALPRSEFLDQSHINTVCTRVQFAGNACPKGSIYGWAKAFTPLLDRPLAGPVYLRSSDNELPDLVADLHGQIDIELSARIDSTKGGGIRTTFENVPDAPVTRFVLAMRGGAKSLLQNSRDICRGRNRARVRGVAHSGAGVSFRPLVVPNCGRKGKARRARQRAAKRAARRSGSRVGAASRAG